MATESISCISQWRCTACTYEENPDSFLTCKICRSVRCAANEPVTTGHAVKVGVVNSTAVDASGIATATGKRSVIIENLAALAKQPGKYSGITPLLDDDQAIVSFAFERLVVTIEVSGDDSDLIWFQTLIDTAKTNRLQVLEQAMEFNYQESRISGGCLSWYKKQDSLTYGCTCRFDEIKNSSDFRDVLYSFVGTALRLLKTFEPSTQDTDAILHGMMPCKAEARPRNVLLPSIQCQPGSFDDSQAKPQFHYDGLKMMIQNEDVASLLQWISAFSMKDTSRQIMSDTFEVLEFISALLERHASYRSEVILLGPELTLVPLLNIMEHACQWSFRPLGVVARAAVILAYLLCSHHKLTISDKQKDQLLGAIHRLRSLEGNDMSEDIGIPVTKIRFLAGAATMCWKGHYETDCDILSPFDETIVETRNAIKLVKALTENPRIWVKPHTKIELLVRLVELSRIDTGACKEMIENGAVPCICQSFYAAPSSDYKARTLLAILLASLLHSNQLYMVADDIQKKAIMDCVEVLCEADNDLVILEKKDFTSSTPSKEPRRVLFAVSLHDIVRSGERAKQIVSKWSDVLVDYKQTTLGCAYASTSNKARESVQIIEASCIDSRVIDDGNISSHDMIGPTKSLRNTSGPLRGVEIVDATSLKQEEHEQFWEEYVLEAPKRSMILSTLELKCLYEGKNVKKLVYLLYCQSCRMLDAALLLMALVDDDKEIGKELMSNQYLHALLGTFFNVTVPLNEVRLAVACIVCRLRLMPSCLLLPPELQTKMSACSEFVKGKEDEAHRIAARALYKVNAYAQFKFEPTSYNYIHDDDVSRIIQANSLGIVCHLSSWLWDDIVGCELKSRNVAKISTNEPCNSSITLNLEHAFAANQFVEDILGRLKDRDAQNTERPSHAIIHRIGNKSVSVPRPVSISFADRPEFLGVSVFHLEHHFLHDVKQYAGLSDGSKFYDIENLNSPTGFVRQQGQFTVCPIDGKLGAAYVHCLQGQDHVGLANHMLSWTWSYNVGDVINTLSKYCRDNSYDPRRVYVWICCLCLNQHRIVKRNNSGIVSNESSVAFENEFLSRIRGIGRLLVMMCPWGNPENFKRIWCIFECVMALESKCEILLVMPPDESKHMASQLLTSFGRTSEQGIDSLYRALNNIDLEKGKASVEQDRERILALIRERMGFQKANMLVRDRLREWVRSVIDALVEQRARSEPDPTADNSLMPYNLSLPYSDFLKQVGDIYDHYGDYSSAHQMYEKCRHIRCFVLGMDHLDVAEAYTDIGRTMFSRGMFLPSLDMYITALRISEKHGIDNLSNARTYFHVGQLLKEMGDVKEAMTMMELCCSIQERLGLDRDAAKTTSHLALVLGESDQIDAKQKGLDMAQRALPILLNLAGGEHPDTAFCYSVIAMILQHSNAEQALRMINQCQEIQESVFGPRHPSLFTTYTLRGDILCKKQRLEYAFHEYCKALACGSSPVSFACTYAKMCVVATFLRRLDEATNLHNFVLQILSSYPQSMDQKLVLIYKRGGTELLHQNQPALAVGLFLRAMALYESMLGKDHHDPVATREAAALALTLYQHGNMIEACRLYQNCLTMTTTPTKEEAILITNQLIAGTTTKWLERRRDSFVASILPKL